MHAKQLILPSLAALLFLSNSLRAEEAVEENISTEASIEGHVPVRSRSMDPDKREQMREIRAKQSSDEQSGDRTDAVKAIRRASNRMNGTQNEFKLASARVDRPQFIQAAYAFPINCHWLTSIADSSRSLELEDGSHWEVSPSDAFTLRYWRREDSLVITPNYSWLSSYDYYITNKSTNSYVKANLIVGPLQNGPYSHWIVDIDYYGGHVYLENQMIWCVNVQDNYLLKDWAVNDHVIFGLYDSWFSPFDHILINVNMDNHLRVKQY
jgi:hypothetical protein